MRADERSGGPVHRIAVEAALAAFADAPVATICAGRTDAGVHAINQVVHFDTDVVRSLDGWTRGTNRYLPSDVAVQWSRVVDDGFHSRASARGRRYAYLLLESPVRPAIEHGMAGWTVRDLDGDAMRRAAECQANSPVKTLRALTIERRGAYWRFDFDADAFLHHMVRNIVGSLVMVGSDVRDAAWLGNVLEARDRSLAAPTFAPDGLYFLGPYYDAVHAIPERTPALDWLP